LRIFVTWLGRRNDAGQPDKDHFPNQIKEKTTSRTRAKNFSFFFSEIVHDADIPPR